jgi:O-antigen/teichoic acid export membrane protein
MIKVLFKDIFKYLPSQIVAGLIGFVSIPIITRFFSPADYGNYSLAMATVNILVVLTGWLSMAIIRFYPEFKRDTNLEYFKSQIAKLSIVSILVISGLFLISIIIIRKWLASQLYKLMLIGILLFALLTFFGIMLQFLRSKREVIWYSIFFIFRVVFGFGLGILLIFLFDFSIEGLFWGLIITLVLILPFLWKKSVNSIKLENTRISKGFIRDISIYSIPLVISNLAAWILSLSDRYILQLYRGSIEVGLYSASYNISGHSVLLFTSLFLLASGPISINIFEKEGEYESKKFITKTTRLFLIICIPLVVGISVLSKQIIIIMTGNEYIDGYRIVPLVALGTFFLGFQQRFQSAFIFYKKTKFIMFSILGSGLLNLVLNFLLIPKYGYMAAAITTLFSYVFLLFLIVLVSRRFFVWKFPFKSLAKVVFASAIMGVAVYFVGKGLTTSIVTNLILGVIIGIVVYILILLLLREAKEEEIKALINAKDKILRKMRVKVNGS